jgi:hypothetical protein
VGIVVAVLLLPFAVRLLLRFGVTLVAVGHFARFISNGYRSLDRWTLIGNPSLRNCDDLMQEGPPMAKRSPGRFHRMH